MYISSCMYTVIAMDLLPCNYLSCEGSQAQVTVQPKVSHVSLPLHLKRLLEELGVTLSEEMDWICLSATRVVSKHHFKG